MFVMKVKSILTTLLLLVVAGLQTAWGQGFRVYKSDGTVAQFSLRTDSIVFYDGIGTDEDFGPFTPVNQCIAKTWYKSKSETVTFGEDGTTDYMDGATYEFLPYQGTVIIYNASGAPAGYFKVLKVTAEQMIVVPAGSESFSVWSTTQPPQLVTGITLSETSLILQPNDAKRLTATVEPADADNPAVTWESSDESVAQVVNNYVFAVANGTCVITCSATDGSGVKAECQVRVANDNSGVIGGREYVDLGLPSGTLWATCNVGAQSPEDTGYYFAWGETTMKSYGDYSWSTYFDTDDGGNTFKKYYLNGGKTELDPADDAATANWGSAWQMPSHEQIQELFNSEYTTIELEEEETGLKITSNSNGNSISLPSGNFCRGNYWSRSLSTAYSYKAFMLYWDPYPWVDPEDLSPIVDLELFTSWDEARWTPSYVRPVRVQN